MVAMSRTRSLVGVNLLYVRPGYMGGTVRYAQELVKHMAQQERFEWRLYLQKEACSVLEPALAALPRTEFSVRGGLAGRVFTEHAILPYVAQADGIDLLFSPGFVSPLWGRFRKVVTIPDMYYKRFPQFVRPWQRRYWQMAIPASLRAADRVVTISESSGADICAAFPAAQSKVRRIYPGADSLAPNAEKSGGKSDSPFCLLVGNITPNKNIDTVVAAFAILREQQPSLRLIIAGSDLFGLMRDALCQQTGKPLIELHEDVSDDALTLLYAQAECLIQASYYEGFGLPVAEAMINGCPVIVSDIPVMREICGDAALYFSPTS
jgi:glycosyltransferase involved in cell wall biosynthesis